MLRTSSTVAIRKRPQSLLFRHLAEAAAKVWFFMQLRRQRLALLELDDRLLRDIGLSHADVQRECSKPVWQR